MVVVAGAAGCKCKPTSQFLGFLLFGCLAKILDMAWRLSVSRSNAWLPGSTSVIDINGNVLASEKWQAFLPLKSSLLGFVSSYFLYFCTIFLPLSYFELI